MDISTKQITQLCAKFLIEVSKKHGFKLKSTHAYELQAAIFGYKTNTSLLTDKQFQLSNLFQAQVILQIPSEHIDLRRKNLQALSQELPKSDILTGIIYNYLKSEKLINSEIFQYSRLEEFALSLTHNYHNQKQLNKIYITPVYEEVKIEISNEGILLQVIPFHNQLSSSEYINDPSLQYKNISTAILTTIWLKRIAGHIGYAEPEINTRSIPMLYKKQS